MSSAKVLGVPGRKFSGAAYAGVPASPESKKGSPKVNFPSRQWFSKVETVS